ncbi:MAG: S8 family peptidase [Chloroflexota bacterium]
MSQKAFRIVGMVVPALIIAALLAVQALPGRATAGSMYRAYLPLVFKDYSPIIIPNDTYFPYQWGLNNAGQSGGTPDADVDAPEAWGITTGSSSVIVAIVDTGVDLDNPEFSGRLTGGQDLVNNDSTADDDNGHGTHVAGIAAATGNNGSGVAGVGWGLRIMPVKVLDNAGSGYASWVSDGITFAVDNGAKVINLSLSGTTYSSSIRSAVDYANAHGVTVVAAAGNCGDPATFNSNGCSQVNQTAYPAAYPGVLAVAATDSTDARASFSTQGSYVDIAAPGASILSTWEGGAYYWSSGTSMASPFVAGLAGLILSIYPSYTPTQVAEAIVNNADDLGAAGHDDAFGCGRINAYESLLNGAVSSGCDGWSGASVSTSAAAAPKSIPAGAEYRPGVLLVKFKESATPDERSRALHGRGLAVGRSLKSLDVDEVTVPPGREEYFLEELNADAAVAYAEPDYLFRAIPIEPRAD